MYECIDSSNTLYSVDEYCILKKKKMQPDIIFCPFCNVEAHIRAENSKEKTHFWHTPTCDNGNYKILFGGEGHAKTKQEILQLKFNILLSSYDIYRYIEKIFNISICSATFISVLKRMSKSSVLKLQGVTTSLIPYIWINELGSYNNRLFLYTNAHNDNIAKVWNLTNSKKDIILCITKNSNKTISKNIIYVDTDFFNSQPSYMDIGFLKHIIPDIFSALQINEKYYDLLLRNLLELCKN